MHAVGNVLGLLYPGRYGLLEFIEVIEEGFELGLVVVPALQLLLVVCPALVSGIVGIVQPVKRGLHARLHLLEAGVALIEIDLLRVKVVEKPIPDDLAYDP